MHREVSFILAIVFGIILTWKKSRESWKYRVFPGRAQIAEFLDVCLIMVTSACRVIRNRCTRTLGSYPPAIKFMVGIIPL